MEGFTLITAIKLCKHELVLVLLFAERRIIGTNLTTTRLMSPWGELSALHLLMGTSSTPYFNTAIIDCTKQKTTKQAITPFMLTSNMFHNDHTQDVLTITLNDCT